VFGIDEAIAGVVEGGSLLLVLAVGVLLGLRHASDPDHLVAVSTLVATEPRRAVRRAALLGLAWGAGHATTLLVCGLPIVLVGRYLPEPVQAGAEALVGVVIAVLALRLLLVWRRGGFHAHAHAHGGLVHRHLHPHAAGGGAEPQRPHVHEHRLLRSPAQAFALGLIHGAAGSAAVGVLLLASIQSRATAVAALVLLALATAVSMAVLSSGLGYVLARAPVRRRLERLAPVLGCAGAVFGVWYAVAAVA
jgi:sulfite exporter TauE/SafE